jgi:hypothetical protein
MVWIQCTSDCRTIPVFKCLFCVRKWNGPVIEWSPSCFSHSKTGQNLFRFWMVTTIITKTFIKRIFFVLKRSRLVVKKRPFRFLNSRPFCYHFKTGPKKHPENDHLKTGSSGFGCSLYFCFRMRQRLLCRLKLKKWFISDVSTWEWH